MNKLYLLPILLMTSFQLGAVCKMMENEPSLEQAEEGLLIAQELHPFKQLFNKEKDGFKKATYLNNAISKSPSEIKYEFDPIIINPGEVVYLEVPENISKRDLLFMVLGHRQNPATEKGTDPVKLTGDGKPFDHLPGLISVQVNRCSTDYKSDWRYWNGMASGEYGSKFAEVGYNMELEGLYEWYKSGHGSVKDKSISTDRLCVNGIRLVNTGKDAVEVGELGLKVTGPKTSQFKETNISPSNKFGDYFTASGRNYGERKDSIMLGYDSGNKNVPDGWTKEDNELYIPAPVGKKLSSSPS